MFRITGASTGIIALALSLLIVAPVLAEDPATAEEVEAASGEWWDDISMDLDVAFYSRYVWRGIVFTKGPVFQPGFTLGYGGLSANIWGNLDLNDVNGNNGEFNEVDYTLDYSFDADKFSFSVGGIVYEFPNIGDSSATTTEVYASASLDVLLSPSMTLYIDVDEVEGLYWTIGIGHSFPLPHDLSLDCSATFGFGSANNNEGYFGVNDASFTDVAVTFEVPIQVTDRFSITPAVSYTGILNDDLRDAVGVDQDTVFGGITGSISF